MKGMIQIVMMTKSFLIIFCCSQLFVIASTVSRTITPISHNQIEWIRKNCGIKRESITRKRETDFKIYGGQETNDFEYPWAVRIRIRKFCYEEGSPIILNLTTRCTGSLISNKHVLTSQHCFTNKKKYQTRHGLVMRNFYYSETPLMATIIAGHGNPTPNFTHETDEIARYIPDRNYFDDKYDRSKYDWALLELKEEVPQNLMDRKIIVPVCLPSNNELVDNFDKVEVYGLGGTQYNDDEGANIGAGTMRYIHTTIKSTMVYENPATHQFLYKDMISLESDISRHGDSGGGVTSAVPVQVNSNTDQNILMEQCKHVLIGITKGNYTNTTIAVDVRTLTDTVQSLTGITI